MYVNMTHIFHQIFLNLWDYYYCAIMKLFHLLTFLALLSYSNAQSILCNNYYSMITPRAVGDWQIDGGGSLNFDPFDPNTFMEYDKWNCLYVVVVRILKQSKFYQWRVILNNSTGPTEENLGCGSFLGPDQGFAGVQNAGNCTFTPNSEGKFRLYMNLKYDQPRLYYDHGVNQCANRPCNLNCDDNGKINPYASNVIRVTGNWPNDLVGVNWQPNQVEGLMVFDTLSDLRCIYSKVITGLKPNKEYEWKATLDSYYLNSYNCDVTGILSNENCKAITDSNGVVRFIFHPYFFPTILTSDRNFISLKVLILAIIFMAQKNLKRWVIGNQEMFLIQLILMD
jgi:hypothetical protein